eukprot:10785849-Alexandrium_andersonii.AAC.1
MPVIPALPRFLPIPPIGWPGRSVATSRLASFLAWTRCVELRLASLMSALMQGSFIRLCPLLPWE